MVHVRSLEGKNRSNPYLRRNCHEVGRVFNARFTDKPICRTYLKELIEKFRRTETVARVKGAEQPLLKSSSKDIVTPP